MIGSTRRLAVYAYGQPCDMRKSFDALCGLVTQALGRDFLSGDVFLFVGRDRKRAKALFWDGTVVNGTPPSISGAGVVFAIARGCWSGQGLWVPFVLSHSRVQPASHDLQ